MQPFHKSQLQIAAALLAFAAAWVAFTSAAQSPSAAARGVDAIRGDDLRQKLTYLASDTFKGRGNGTPELNKAAQYIAGIFESNGVKPAGGAGGFDQRFEIYSAGLGRANSLRIGNREGSDQQLLAGVDFLPAPWSQSGAVDAPLEIVDGNFAALPDLKGKIAVEVEDRISSDDPEFPEEASEGRRFQDAGAVGFIVVESVGSGRARIQNMMEMFREDLPVRLTPMFVTGVPDYPDIPVAVLSASAGRQLVAELRGEHPDIHAALTVDVNRNLRQSQNVLGLIEGADPILRNEVVIVGAHYDHDGEAFGQIWYGADDDGSGTTALLALAEAFGRGAARPARSILLAAWAGEEKGLLGSRYYVAHPRFPLSRTIAMFQMDMIGRNEDHAGSPLQQIPEEHASENGNALNVLGTAFSPDLRAAISKMNDQTALTLHFRYDFAAEDLLRRSDQWSFLRKGIPSIFFFSGLHPDYHTPRDTPDKINYPKLEKTARLVYLLTYQIAMAPKPPRFTNAGQR